ncbi:MAG TPA: hypothetical protein VFS91_12325 [Nitrobacter sp.]|nr:hypothetical protein [Nitrobacter sp.]
MGSLAQTYVRWHFPVGCALLLALSLVAFSDNLVSDVTQPSNSNPVMIVHGLFLLTWMVLLLVQSMLPRLGRTDLHRRIGPYAFLAAAGVGVSTIFLFAVVWKGWAALTPEVLANRILLPSYAVCIYAAYRNRMRPEWHKRLVYCGTLLLSEPVLARTFDPLVGPLLPPMAPGEDMPIFYAYLIIVWTGFFVALMIYDRLKSRRIHPVTVGSLGWLYAVYAVAFAIAPAA